MTTIIRNSNVKRDARGVMIAPPAPAAPRKHHVIPYAVVRRMNLYHNDAAPHAKCDKCEHMYVLPYMRCHTAYNDETWVCGWCDTGHDPAAPIETANTPKSEAAHTAAGKVWVSVNGLAPVLRDVPDVAAHAAQTFANNPSVTTLTYAKSRGAKPYRVFDRRAQRPAAVLDPKVAS